MAIKNEGEHFVVTPTKSDEKLGVFKTAKEAVKYQQIMLRLGGLEAKYVSQAQAILAVELKALPPDSVESQASADQQLQSPTDTPPGLVEDQSMNPNQTMQEPGLPAPQESMMSPELPPDTQPALPSLPPEQMGAGLPPSIAATPMQ